MDLEIFDRRQHHAPAPSCETLRKSAPIKPGGGGPAVTLPGVGPFHIAVVCDRDRSVQACDGALAGAAKNCWRGLHGNKVIYRSAQFRKEPLWIAYDEPPQTDLAAANALPTGYSPIIWSGGAPKTTN